MFALIWYHLALEQLADVYVGLPLEERERLAAAVEALNLRLQADPLSEGESRSSGYRIAFLFKLAVVFHVSQQDGIVRVVRVKKYG